MSSPTISVVTPSYNQAEFIEETLQSVARQTWSAVDHVVVDGESDDGTVDLLQAWDDRVRWRSEPDEGQADAINTGFDMARGDIVGWLNSDDVYFDTGVLARVATHFEQSDADVVYGDIGLLDADSRVLKLRCVPDFDYSRLRRGCFIEQPALFFRQHVLEDARLDPDLEFAMDYEFWLRLGTEYEFHHVSDVLAGDRNHPGRKILHERDAMRAESREVAAWYGLESGWRYRYGRGIDVLASGVPRRLRAIRRTLALHRSPPELAFDGTLAPLPVMVRNVFEQNRNL